MKQADLHINIELLQKGDEKAFEKIYDSYSPSIYGICLKVVGNEDDASDVLQDTFVKVWKNAQKYDKSKGSFFTWMLNIARNTAIDKTRKLSGGKNISFQSIQNEDGDVYIKESAHAKQNIETIGLQDLLDTMPDEQKIIIEYLYFKGYTQQETADELNLPLGTVKTRSRSALKQLKELFGILIAWM